MIFLLVLVSIGTMHVILAADAKRKSQKTVIHPAQAPAIAPPPPAGPEQSTQEVWSLMHALEQHGRGETPGTEVPVPPKVAESTPKDC